MKKKMIWMKKWSKIHLQKGWFINRNNSPVLSLKKLQVFLYYFSYPRDANPKAIFIAVNDILGEIWQAIGDKS